LGLLLLLVLVTVRAVDPAPLRYLRARTFDLYQALQPREIGARPVVIVDIDDTSLNALGQWPWPRTMLADIVTRLFEYGVGLVAFDIVFPEPDRTSPAFLARRLPTVTPEVRAALEALPDNSAVLAEAMARGAVILSLGITPKSITDRPPPRDPPSMALIGEDPRPHMTQYGPVLGNLPVLEDAAVGRGVFAVSAEDDGVVRRVPMVLNADGTLWPSLSTEILRVATNTVTIGVRARGASSRGSGGPGIEGLVIGNVFVPTDAQGRLWIHFSRHDPEKYVSAVDVLRGTVDPARLAGRVAIIGTSAVGLLDLKTTPVSQAMPGVEVHAQVIESIVDGSVLTRSRLADALEILLALVTGGVLIVLVPWVGATWAMVLLLGSVCGLGAGSWIAFSEHLTLFDPVFPGLVAVALHILLSYTSHARAEAQRRYIRTAFNHYMTPALVERLARSPAHLHLGGETRELTILFCDIRGFTILSEGYDAESLVRLINRFLSPMSEVIMTHNGTIDKYIGDCIMAFWNAPLDDPDHAAHAAQAALAMCDRLNALNAELATEAAQAGQPAQPLRIGIGLNTGSVSVGNMGSEQRFDYSVLGDAVNLASGLEGLSKLYGVTIVLGETTAARLEGLALVEMDRIRVRGRRALTRVFALLGDASAAGRADMMALRTTQTELLAAMRAQQWDIAERHLIEARRLAVAVGVDLAGLHALYDRRLRANREVPPGPDWDGVFE